MERLKQSLQTLDRSGFFQTMWDGKTETASTFISDLLFESIRYYDYSESYYHAFLAGLFAGGGYIVESNFEYGNGRPDLPYGIAFSGKDCLVMADNPSL